jgi:predicted 2-oxoglutarate/Fe(II)-dependent dioxygenase YbiX
MSYILENNFMQEDHAKLFVYYFTTQIEKEKTQNRDNSAFDNRIIYYRRITDKFIKDLLTSYVSQIRDKLIKHYNIQHPLFPDSVHIVRWNTGQSLGEHADAFYMNGSPNYTPYRKYSSVVFLNQEFEGGTLQFTKGSCDVISPEIGKLAAFTAGLQDTHQVNTVTSGTRYTLACWFTDSEPHAIHEFKTDLSDPFAKLSL